MRERGLFVCKVQVSHVFFNEMLENIPISDVVSNWIESPRVP